MSNLWKDLKPGENIPESVYTIVEIPKGSRNKYEYNKEMEAFEVDRVLYSPVHYPADYGFIPQTTYDDGDPMDIIVLMDQPTFPGCIINSRPIGLMKMIDTGEKDYKILAVPVDNPGFNEVKDISDLPEHIPKEIGHFFSVYKNLQEKEVKILGWEDAKSAKKELIHSIDLYKEKYL